MFRERLKNVYTKLGMQYPDYLDKTIITKIEVPFKQPQRAISPRMDGLQSSADDWFYAGTMSMLDGPVYRENKNVDKIEFGYDNENIYFRMHINKNSSENSIFERINQFYIYTRNATSPSNRANIRLISKTDNLYPILSEKFEHEFTLTLVKDYLYPPRLSTVFHNNLWTLDNPDSIKVVYNDVIDVKLPFDKIGINTGEKVEFFMANTDSGVKNTSIPQDVLLSVTRM